MSYAKLFSTITESSLWSGSKEARILFVSILARANAVGFIEAAVPGLARMANLTVPETESALSELMAPDPYSKSTVAEGRRLAKVPGGWCLVTYETYRARRDEEERREYMREYMHKYRNKEGSEPVNSCKLVLTDVNYGKPGKPKLAQADADADADAEEKRTHARPSVAECPIFAEFWEGYGRKVGKSLALKAWAKLTEAERMDALEGVPAFVASTPDPQYRPHPVRYLTHRRWEDEEASPGASPSSDGMNWSGPLPSPEEARRALGLSDG